MDSSGERLNETARFVRLALWGQIIGYLSFGVGLALEDFPRIFSRAGAVEFIWPIAVLAAMYVFRLDSVAARRVPRLVLVLSILVISLGTVAASVTGVMYAYGIPSSLSTPGSRYLQATTSITLGIFAIALLINLVLAIRVYQASDREKFSSFA